jgi:putative lipase involved disintegration of autophagic bodies
MKKILWDVFIFLAVSIHPHPTTVAAPPPQLTFQSDATPSEHLFLPPSSVTFSSLSPEIPRSLSLKSRPSTVLRPTSLNLTRLHTLRHSSHTLSKLIRNPFTSSPFQILHALQDYDDALTAYGSWSEEEVLLPDFDDWDTIRTLAYMAGNSYVPISDVYPPKDWYDLGEKWNVSLSFGWTVPIIRGHAFVSENEEIVVVAIKGTSAGFVGGGGDTSKNDKFNVGLNSSTTSFHHFGIGDHYHLTHRITCCSLVAALE